MKRVLVNKKIKDIDMWSLDGLSIQEALQFILTESKSIDSKKWNNIKLNINQGYELTEIELWGDREENDEEYNERQKQISRAEKKKQDKAERERQTYEKLKAKYEN